MRVCIGVSSGELARYAMFWDGLVHVIGVTNENVICARGANIAENRNGIGLRAVQLGYHAVWYVDDDQVFPPDTLQKLIAHDKDIVSGLYLQRGVPFVPHVYSRSDPEAGWYPRVLRKGDSGLVECLSVGAGCLLVKTDVLRKMGKPWWRLGQYDKVNWTDDHDFCMRAGAAGFKVWADLDAPVGHQLNGTIWPVRQPDGAWNTTLVQGDTPLVCWPPAQEAEEVAGK